MGMSGRSLRLDVTEDCDRTISAQAVKSEGEVLVLVSKGKLM